MLQGTTLFKYRDTYHPGKDPGSWFQPFQVLAVPAHSLALCHRTNRKGKISIQKEEKLIFIYNIYNASPQQTFHIGLRTETAKQR